MDKFIEANQILRISTLEESQEFKRGFIHAQVDPSTTQAAFICNLNIPTENPQRKDIYRVEEYLHGYYTAWILDLQRKMDLLNKDVAYWRALADSRKEGVPNGRKNRTSKLSRG